MSRKNKQRKPEPLITAEDLGGLDLSVATLPPPPPAPLTLTSALESLPAEKVLELAETVLPTLQQDGLNLEAALRQSPYCYLAAHPAGEGMEGTVVVSNGQRFWTATEQGLNPNMHPYNYDIAYERTRSDWRPVLGNEGGLYIA